MMKKLALFMMMLPLACLFYGNVLAETVQLPRTGQTICYNSSGTVIPCAGTGQDGDIRAGVEWPVFRFGDNGNGTMTDNLTGLIWLKRADLCNARPWQSALNYIAQLNSNPASFNIPGFTDTSGGWRLPNINELESLMNSDVTSSANWLLGLGFTYVRTYYWSSTSFASSPSTTAQVMDLGLGFVGNNNKTYNYYIWPVKGPVGNPPAKVLKTGQTESYANYDDGYYETGASYSGDRFIINPDETVTDNLTGLMWMKNVSYYATRNWTDALTAANSSTFANHDDWRLPNIKELCSLMDFSQYNPGLPAGHPFLNLNYHFSSTTHPHYKNYYRDAYLPAGGGTTATPKYAIEAVWLVRTATHSLSVIFNPTNAGYVTVDDEECVSSPCKITRHNQEVVMEAFPECGYEFDHWEWNDGANASTENPMDFTVGDDEVVTAVFNWNIKLPLPGNKNWLLSVEAGGEIQCNGGTDQYHTGTGYYALDFTDNTSEDGHLDGTDVPILATANGVVAFAGGDPSTGYGYNVVIDHGNGYKTRYAHLKYSPTVSGSVTQGQQIGVMGNTGGYSTGIHLHFQLYYEDDSSSNNEGLALVRLEGISLNSYQVGCNEYYPSSNN